MYFEAWRPGFCRIRMAAELLVTAHNIRHAPTGKVRAGFCTSWSRFSKDMALLEFLATTNWIFCHKINLLTDGEPIFAHWSKIWLGGTTTTAVSHSRIHECTRYGTPKCVIRRLSCEWKCDVSWAVSQMLRSQTANFA